MTRLVPMPVLGCLYRFTKRRLSNWWMSVGLSLLPVPLLLIGLVQNAHAEFTHATLLSGTTRLQFERANAPALAREGDYVAFEGALAGIAGVWRRDLQNGTIEPVAVSEPENSAISASDAAAPSISADGRYVAFTTTADLEPEHPSASGPGEEGEPAVDRGCPEVYVRDMDIPANAPGAYTLASALSGGEGIAFGGSCASASEGFSVAGAQAAPGVALSADGRSVAFTVLSPSDLAGGPGGPASTPPSQVVVHDLENDTTTLVSVTPEGQPVSGGGAFPSAESEQLIHASTAQASLLGNDITGSTAAISGDGSTVAWLGSDVPAQVPGSGPEIEAAIPETGGRSVAAAEVEPLWRRIGDGPAAFTQRLLADAGLDFFYFRDEELEIIQGGSFVDTGGSSDLFTAPALSYTGQSVAVISNAPRPVAVRSLQLSGELPQTDAYLVRVQDNAASAPQVTPLTETLDYDTTTGAQGFVRDVTISADGNHVAFESERTQFTLPALALISPTAGTHVPQSYEANVQLGTLQRVTSTYDGSEPIGGSAGLLAFSGDGTKLSFASSARNLFYGDAISAFEVYLTEEIPSSGQAAIEQLGPVPLAALAGPEWALDATASPQRDGSVLVYASVPGAGKLEVRAIAQLSVTKARAARHTKTTKTRPRAKASKTTVHKLRFSSRTVAQGVSTAKTSVNLRLRLRVSAPYRSLVDGKGLYTVLHVAFSTPHRGTLTASIPVTFHRIPTRQHPHGAGR